MKLDKRFLLCYTDIGEDRRRHCRCAWFRSKQALQTFVSEKKGRETFEIDFAVEIKNYRPVRA